MLQVLRLGLGELRVLGQIIVAVGHPQPALHHVQRILIGRLAILTDEHVEGDSDAKAVRVRIELREIFLRLGAAHLVQPRFERCKPLRLD